MKYPCELIRDLLPLYQDGVSSEKSADAVRTHLAECEECRKYAASLSTPLALSAGAPEKDAPIDRGFEIQKAASFRSLRRRLLRRQVLTLCAAFLLLAASVLSGFAYLQNAGQVIDYDENLSVSMTDEGLVSRLQGDQAQFMEAKRIEQDGKAYLVFCLSGTKWSALSTGSKLFSEYVLCPAEKGSGDIDAVYYYTGDYAGLEELSTEELQTVLDGCVLLWSR